MKNSSCTKEEKYRNLLDGLRSLNSAAVAFSGGLDSTFLLHAARQALGENVLAVTMVTPYMPAWEIEDARNAAQAMQVRHLLLDVPIPESIRNNPPERCYLCKKSLFGMIRRTAAEENIPHVLDGTNLDDLDDYRPGLKALGELQVKSPLLEAGLTKQDIRGLAAESGLAVWDKPAGACLLTRLPHGVTVQETDLGRIERAECFLRQIGFTAVRLRTHGDVARVEVPRDMVAEVVEADKKHGIDAYLKALGYRHVAVDLAGYRTGSLNQAAG